MKKVIVSTLFGLVIFVSVQAQNTPDEPLLPQNENYFEGFAEQLMESLDIENIQDQMMELTEKLKSYSGDFENEPHQWMDSLRNGMQNDSEYFFLDQFDRENLGGQFEGLQEMLMPMLDSMLMGNDFMKSFGLGQLGESNGSPFDMEQFFGQSQLKNFGSGSNSTINAIEAELWKEGLFTEGNINKMELTGRSLKINGQRQDQDTFKKYKQLYEQSSGHELHEDSMISLSFGSENPSKKRKTRRI